MPARRVPLDYELFHRMYVVERMTIRAISAHFGNPGARSILNTVKKLGLSRPEKIRSNRRPGDPNEVVRLYREGLTCAAIAMRYPCSTAYIRKLLVRHGEPMRHAGRMRRLHCRVKGCSEPVHLVKQHGVMTGTMCLPHRREYYALRAKISWRRKHNVRSNSYRRRKYDIIPQLELVPSRLIAVLTASVAGVQAGARCRQRACPYPAAKNGYCRQHYLDSVASASPLQASCSQLSEAAELFAL